jgi:hypothetical protein
VLVLYAGAFDPGAPLDGIVGYAEPDPTAPTARRLLLSVELVAGAPYVLVTTGIGNGDAGAFTNSTFGPTGGGVVVSSEGAPATHALELSAPAPNPGSERISMSLLSGVSQEVRADLFDPLGRRVALLLDAGLGAGTSVPLVVDVAGLNPGVYVVRIVGDTATISRTITVTR